MSCPTIGYKAQRLRIAAIAYIASKFHLRFVKHPFTEDFESSLFFCTFYPEDSALSEHIDELISNVSYIKKRNITGFHIGA